MKIGVLADTHIPDLRRSLPSRVMEIFSTVEIVLHAGDITSLQVLQQLQESVSLTFAVYGEDDSLEVKQYLRDSQVLEFGGLRVGLIHGNRGSRTELSTRVDRFLGRDPYTIYGLSWAVSTTWMPSSLDTPMSPMLVFTKASFSLTRAQSTPTGVMQA
jgi:Calcineurin-like phosphoesterase superfamily domain